MIRIWNCMQTRGEQCVANWVIIWKIHFQLLTYTHGPCRRFRGNQDVDDTRTFLRKVLTQLNCEYMVTDNVTAQHKNCPCSGIDDRPGRDLFRGVEEIAHFSTASTWSSTKWFRWEGSRQHDRTLTKIASALENFPATVIMPSKSSQFVKKYTTKLVVFLPMQFSYEALQRCMLLARSLLNTSSVIQLRPSASVCSLIVRLQLDCVWCASCHIRNIINRLVIFVDQSEAVKFWLFLWSLNQALKDWPNIHSTHETKYLYNNLVKTFNPSFFENPLKLKRFRVFAFQSKSTKILCKENFGTNQWKLFQTLKCMFTHWANLLSYKTLQNVFTKWGNLFEKILACVNVIKFLCWKFEEYRSIISSPIFSMYCAFQIVVFRFFLCNFTVCET